MESSYRDGEVSDHRSESNLGSIDVLGRFARARALFSPCEPLSRIREHCARVRCNLSGIASTACVFVWVLRAWQKSDRSASVVWRYESVAGAKKE